MRSVCYAFFRFGYIIGRLWNSFWSQAVFSDFKNCSTVYRSQGTQTEWCHGVNFVVICGHRRFP